MEEEYWMALSEDEEEAVPNSITNYHFEDKDGAPITFSILPLILDDAENAEAPRQQVSVRGTTDGGLQSVFKGVIAWKLSLDEENPQVSVLSKENKWIKLEKPKKSFEECIRPVLITIHLLHLSKKNPEASIKSSWEHLRHVLGPFDDRPFDLSDHVQLVKLYMDRDESLSNSQVLQTVERTPKMLLVRPFIIDDELEYGIDVDKGNGDESEDESDLFDSVCSICDNGGELLCCEGRCLRSFHATKRAGEDSDCASLGLTRTQVDAMQNFLCKNCQLKKHQCFACGKLGSSDKSGSAEEISFEDIEGEDIIQRAWEGLLPNRILIYCMKHDIDNELGTPARDHIIFPESLDKKRERDQLKPKLNKDKQASDSVTGDINLAKHVKKIEKKAADGSHKLKIAKAFSKQSIDSSQPTWKASMKVAKSALEKVESKEIVKSALTKMEELKLKIGRASIDKTKVSDSAVNVHGKLKNSAPKIPDEIRKDVLALVEEESSSLTMEDIKKTLLMPSTHASSAGQIDKSITLGKVEGAIEAVRTALEKLDAGGNVEDARAV
ncbi:hypothetical protein HPP92_004668 [Vanilla planifolia]|uniref:RFTS domain-containing protein n=1 Tax=Vanilla planifolia TaxID=51239 RepID=A0A835RFD0_VANPL|nr:hypothetical protein HPP92_004668 [Vanilla planifolia]